MIVLLGEIRNTSVDSAFVQELSNCIPRPIIRLFCRLAVIAITEVGGHSMPLAVNSIILVFALTVVPMV